MDTCKHDNYHFSNRYNVIGIFVSVFHVLMYSFLTTIISHIIFSLHFFFLDEEWTPDLRTQGDSENLHIRSWVQAEPNDRKTGSSRQHKIMKVD